MAWIILFGGFRQRHTRPNGVLSLYRKLDKFRAPGVEMRLCYWDENTRRLAGQMAMIGADGVLIAGYSYGGWAAVQLCRRLQAHGIGVDWLLLSDPVWRCRWLRPINALHAMLPRMSILKRTLHVPGNVKTVHVWVQDTEAPFASHVHAPLRALTVVPRTPHVGMDDLRAWHDAVLISTAMLLEKPK